MPITTCGWLPALLGRDLGSLVLLGSAVCSALTAPAPAFRWVPWLPAIEAGGRGLTAAGFLGFAPLCPDLGSPDVTLGLGTFGLCSSAGALGFPDTSSAIPASLLSSVRVDETTLQVERVSDLSSASPRTGGLLPVPGLPKHG
jgi:hypothetical protein